MLARFPKLPRALYQLIAFGGPRLLTDVTTRPSWRRRVVQAYARACLRIQVCDKALRTKLEPDYQPLCKRQVVSGTYYRAIRADNADLVTDGIAEVTPHGIRTAGGTRRDTDVIVLATGFHAHSYMPPMRLIGRDRINIDDAVAMGPTVWNTGCNSWYRTEDGAVDLWPFDRATMKAMLGSPEPADFHLG